MFLPLGDEPNPRGIPWVTYSLIAVNTAVYLFISLPLSFGRPDASDPLLVEYVQVLLETLPQDRFVASEVVQQLSAYDLFVFDHGFRPAAPAPIALLTSMFLHAGFAHLAGNMLFLWIYGDNVEHRLGPVLYLTAYLATGVAATLFHTVFDLGSALPLVGASGAISGVLGFYFVWFPTQPCARLGLSLSVLHERHYASGEDRAGLLSGVLESHAVPNQPRGARGRCGLRCAHRWVSGRVRMGVVGRSARSVGSARRISSWAHRSPVSG